MYRWSHEHGDLNIDGMPVPASMIPFLWDGDCFKRKLAMPLQKIMDMRKDKPRRVLDYGCDKARYLQDLGFGDLWFDEWVLYDPGYNKYRTEPHGTFDYIVCADVMEHVLDYEATLAKINGLLKDDGIVLFSISGHPDRRSFKDGTNMHVTLLSKNEWVALMEKHFGSKKVIMRYNNRELWESRAPRAPKE